MVGTKFSVTGVSPKGVKSRKLPSVTSGVAHKPPDPNFHQISSDVRVMLCYCKFTDAPLFTTFNLMKNKINVVHMVQTHFKMKEQKKHLSIGTTFFQPYIAQGEK